MRNSDGYTVNPRYRDPGLPLIPLGSNQLDFNNPKLEEKALIENIFGLPILIRTAKQRIPHTLRQ
ncbi:hypothetical protein D9X91_12765 [Falsibacillus albus]|uniref:Uncharacterized protein n=1 Tax=Falsibacillus albus TaxID=2478915 RepID=A0A3L7JVV4_9BACI|nr:hypothetical protein D9X91_12765 [Falsibacillus albus]